MRASRSHSSVALGSDCQEKQLLETELKYGFTRSHVRPKVGSAAPCVPAEPASQGAPADANGWWMDGARSPLPRLLVTQVSTVPAGRCATTVRAWRAAVTR